MIAARPASKREFLRKPVDRPCSRCGAPFLVEEFYFRKNGARASECNSCVSKRIVENNRKNPKKRLARSRRYHARHKIREMESARTKKRHRRKTDIAFRIKSALSKRVRELVSGKCRAEHSAQLLGCTIDQFLGHIEINFSPGMTWENYGFRGWHLDHIKPCASFDLTDPVQQKECFNWKNYQPLWAEDNMRKGAKVL